MLETISSKESTRTSAFAASALIFAVVSTPLVVWLHFFRHKDHILDLDQPALLAHTLASGPRGWFTEGFSSYFSNYPEWAAPNSNFLRPFAQFVIYGLHSVFGDSYELYFIAFYTAQLLIVLGIVHVLSLMQAPRALQIMAALLCCVSSAFVNTGLISIAFMFDLVAAALCFAAFIALIHERYALTWFFLTIAVLTKETALPTTIAAAATIFFLRPGTDLRRWGLIGLFLTPTILWALLRWQAFGSILGGAIGLGKTQPMGPVTWAAGVATWPTGIAKVDGLGAIFRGDYANPYIPDAVAYSGMNIFIWLTLALGLTGAARQFVLQGEGSMSFGDRILSAAWIWLTACLAYVTLLALPEPRFGSVMFIFLLLVLTPKARADQSRLLRLSAAVSLIFLGAAFLISDVRFFSDTPHVAERWKSLRTLADALIRLPQNGARILVINAPTIYLNPKYESDFLHVKREIVFVNQLAVQTDCKVANDGAEAVDGGAPIRKVARADGRIGVSIYLSRCLRFSFLNAGDAFEDMHLHNYSVARKGVGLYEFPNARVVKTLLRGGHEYEFGNLLNFYPDDASTDVLAQDVDSKEFVLLNRFTAAEGQDKNQPGQAAQGL